MAADNLFPRHGMVKRQHREELNGHRGAVVWFTGLSGSGKTTLAQAVEGQLFLAGCHSYVLDGDHLRQGLCADLGFSAKDRTENIRRAGETAGLLADAGMIVLAAFISPFNADRERVRARMALGDFIEVHCDCPLDVCEQRDVKGLYRRARAGEILQFTAVSAPYEAPLNPELVLDTARLSLSDCTALVLAKLRERAIIAAKPQNL
ncbi:adenylyl-sulfate kinase [Pseudoduganella sp. LjRoot289]|uniref:adenylyl-sulfate kinase n=1 Tax=Pseudoduganella sp. LjRoot289 TaxID=3342314 RepID=UPI003ED0660F